MRLKEVMTLMLQGLTAEEVIRVSTERWNIKRRQVEKYMEKSRGQMAELLQQDRQVIVAEHLAHRRELRAIARERGDVKAELMIAQDEAKLRGLYIERTVTIDLTGLSDEQLLQIAEGTDPDIVIASTSPRALPAPADSETAVP